MTSDLVLLCHGATAATRVAAFGSDVPLLPGIGAAVAAWGADRRWPVLAWTSPARAATETAAALGLAASPEPALADPDFGRWTGRAIAEVLSDDGAALEAWMTDADARAPGGESRAALAARVGAWLGQRLPEGGRAVAVTHPSVVRAALGIVLDAPPAAFFAIDVAPLARLHLRGDGRRWALRGLLPAPRLRGDRRDDEDDR